jgi:hypothetical protein
MSNYVHFDGNAGCVWFLLILALLFCSGIAVGALIW